MAGIDKIYLTEEEMKEYWLWVLGHKEDCYNKTYYDLTGYCYKGTNGYIINYSESIDWYLWNYCDLLFIQARLKEQYSSRIPKNEIAEITRILSLLLEEDRKYILENFDSFDEYKIDDYMMTERNKRDYYDE